MNRSASKVQIISIALLCFIFTSTLLPALITKNPYPFSNSEEQIQTENVNTPPNSPPIPAMGVPNTTIFTIIQSADDARTMNAGTDASAVTLNLGGINNVAHNNNQKVCLRWNISIPENHNVVSAYLNITVQGSATYNGFLSNLYAFDSIDTPDFSNPSENIYLTRPRTTSSVSWQMPNPATPGQSYLSPNIASLMNNIIGRPDWENNSIFGLIIIAGGLWAGVDSGEFLYFHSFDGPNPLFKPKLIVEWEHNPGFRSTPPDITINNQTLGYHVDWTAADDNPENYIIYGNETIGGPTEIVKSGTWESEVEIKYDIPKINIQNLPFIVINYTIYIYDTNGNFDNDTVFVNVTDKGLPVIDVKFVQGGKSFSYEDRKYFDTSKGPFTIQIYNKTPLIPSILMYAIYPENHLKLLVELNVLGLILVNGTVHIDERTYYDLLYDTSSSAFNYSEELGCWQLTPVVGGLNGLGADNYTWQLAIELPPPLDGFSIYEYYDRPIQDIIYDLTNYFWILINSWGSEFIYLNKTVYTVKSTIGMWDDLTFEMLNKDLTPPSYEEPEFIEPEDPDKHYEIKIFAYTEEYGADIDEVFLYYKINDGDWKTTEMVFQNGKYYGEIPPQEGGAEITYYIEIVDIAGNRIKTDEYTETATIFEEPSPIVPIIGILIAVLGALSVVVVYRIKHKTPHERPYKEKMTKKSAGAPKRGNKIYTKIKKVKKLWSEE